MTIANSARKKCFIQVVSDGLDLSGQFLPINTITACIGAGTNKKVMGQIGIQKIAHVKIGVNLDKGRMMYPNTEKIDE